MISQLLLLEIFSDPLFCSPLFKIVFLTYTMIYNLVLKFKIFIIATGDPFRDTRNLSHSRSEFSVFLF